MLQRLHLFVLPGVFLFIVGCGSKAEKTDQAAADVSQNPVPTVEYASGWEEVIIDSPQAKVTIDQLGHFSTNRNACLMREAGVLKLDDWNTFAKGMNVAAKEQPLAEAACFPVVTSRYGFTPGYVGTVEIKINNSKRIIYEIKGNDICSTIPDTDISKNLNNTINNILATAASEGCASALF